MISPPVVEIRPARPCVAIEAVVAPMELGPAGSAAVDRVMAWVAARGGRPTDGPFFRYRRIDMPRGFDMAFGVTLEAPLEGADGIVAGELPAGRYAVATFTGPYPGLRDATAALLAWIAAAGFTIDGRETADGDTFACRVETYRSDPDVEPDPARWVTEMAIRLADTP